MPHIGLLDISDESLIHAASREAPPQQARAHCAVPRPVAALAYRSRVRVRNAADVRCSRAPSADGCMRARRHARIQARTLIARCPMRSQRVPVPVLSELVRMCMCVL